MSCEKTGGAKLSAHGKEPSRMDEIKEIFWQLVDPWLFMAASLSYFPGTIKRLVLSGDFGTLFSWEALQTSWFGRFWSWAGPMVRQTGEARVVPLLEGRVAGGSISTTPVAPGVRGVVMEIGAGSGMWIELFSNNYHGKYSTDSASRGGISTQQDKTSRTASGRQQLQLLLGRGQVTKVYGIEPNPESHEALTRRVRETGMEDIYEVVPVGIEHLGTGHQKWDKKIEEESVDCLVGILCLCSIPNPEENIRELYRYLKPGGRWYVYEHVGCPKSAGKGMVWYQRLLNFFWPHVMGGCILTRDTERYLLEAGPWAKTDLTQPEDEPWYHAVPHIYGILTK